MFIKYELAGHSVFRVIYNDNVIGCTYEIYDPNRDSYWVAHYYNKSGTTFKGKSRHDASKKLIKHCLQEHPFRIK